MDGPLVELVRRDTSTILPRYVAAAPDRRGIACAHETACRRGLRPVRGTPDLVPRGGRPPRHPGRRARAARHAARRAGCDARLPAVHDRPGRGRPGGGVLRPDRQREVHPLPGPGLPISSRVACPCAIEPASSTTWASVTVTTS